MEVNDKVVYAALVVLMMLATLSVVLVYSGLSASYVDEREASHEYTVEGTLDGDACTGAGTSEYVPETTAGRLYEFSFTISSEQKTIDLEFGIAFDTEDTPLTELYECIGTGTVDGVAVTIWYCEDNGVEYTFYVGELCTVQRVTVESSGYSVTGYIV